MRLIVTMIWFFSLWGATSNALVIDRVIVASDTHPGYLSFWPVAAKAWRALLGCTPTLILIAPDDVEVDETCGDVIRIRPIEGIKTAYLAKVIRLFAPALFPDDVCMIADIDLVPLSKHLFAEPLEPIADDHFVSFHAHEREYIECGPVVGKRQRLMMSYNVAKGRLFGDIFGAHTIEQILDRLCQWYDPLRYNTMDEHKLTRYIAEWHKKTKRHIFLNRNYKTEMLPFTFSGGRKGFEAMLYDEQRLRSGGYKDIFFCPRPYDDPGNKKAIDAIIALVLQGHLPVTSGKEQKGTGSFA